MQPGNGQPIFILREGTERNHGRAAQSGNIAAARAVAEAVRSTLGPKGMDKMLVDEAGDVIITNDGATILREMDIEHPAAKMIIEVSKTQEQECYDGTTTAVILSGELLKRSEELISQNIHPTTITDSFRRVGNELNTLVEELAVKSSEEHLLDVARTSLTGKSASNVRDFLGSVCVEAVQRLAENGNINLDHIAVVKAVGGEATDSSLIDSVVLDKERAHPSMPESLNNPRICLLNTAMVVKTTEMDANIQITDPTQIEAFLEQEEQSIKDMALKVAEFANVVVCQREIDDLAKHYLAKLGVLAVEKVPKTDIETLSRATGASILSTLDDLTSEDECGKCDTVIEQYVGEIPMVFFDGPTNRAVTLLLRGGTVPFVEEVERAFDDAVGVVKVAYEDGQVLPGGGATFAALAHMLDELAAKHIGRERLAIEAFAEAMLIVPRTLVENAGLDPVDEMMTLRTAHASGEHIMGVNVEDGGLSNMSKMGVWEPKRVVSQAIKSAVETAIMILRIDDVISRAKKA